MVIILERPDNILSEDNPCRCVGMRSVPHVQSSVVLPLISELVSIRVWVYQIMCVCACAHVCVSLCVYVCMCLCVCLCESIVVSMVMRFDTTSRRRGGSLLLNNINLESFYA